MFLKGLISRFNNSNITLRINKEELKTTKEGNHHKVNNKQEMPQIMLKDQVSNKDQHQLPIIKDLRFLLHSKSTSNPSNSISRLRIANSSSQGKPTLLMIVYITIMGMETPPSRMPIIRSNRHLYAKRDRKEHQSKELSLLMHRRITLFRDHNQDQEDILDQC
jgi:hypothetical protein